MGSQISTPRRSKARKLAKLERRHQNIPGPWLLSNYVFLDLDDKIGKDPYGRWVAVVYLSEDGRPGRNFNKMLVDSGHAVIEDFKNNEFDPGSWRPPLRPGEAEEESPKSSL